MLWVGLILIELKQQDPDYKPGAPAPLAVPLTCPQTLRPETFDIYLPSDRKLHRYYYIYVKVLQKSLLILSR